ncbi:MAG: hypothetical protein EXR75_16585, partial [Myxococcales bacterium]|nr:hypothetical protein [Myxococcales bacterium]
VFRFEARAHEDLAALDVDAVLDRGETAAEAQGGTRVAALYIVCAHGKRDACCAKKGAALYRALAQTEHDGELWQSTHQGGHRFAATMLYLPLGVHYGRLEPNDAPRIVAEHAQKKLYDLEFYRGHTSLSPFVQRAEAWLREALDERAIDALTLIDEERIDDRMRAVRMRDRDGTVHRIFMAPKTAKELRMASCVGAEPTRVAFSDVLRYEAHSPVLRGRS